MALKDVYQWISQEKDRSDFVMGLTQPMTAGQIARKTGIRLDTCSHLTGKCVAQGLLVCLNPQQRNSRLYWLTVRGRRLSKKLHRDANLPYKEFDLPAISWSLYGWVCFTHRSAVIKTLSGPMQPSQIKRVLMIHQSSIKINTNNIRDIIKLLLSKNIVKSVQVKKKAHPRYELTETGLQLKRLLQKAHA